MYSISANFTGEFWKKASVSPEITDSELRKAMNEATMHIQGKVIPLTPIHTGTARASISSAIEGEAAEIRGRIGSPLKYMLPLEYGRRPGQTAPPVSAIERWFTLKGLVPTAGKTIEKASFLIARAIGRRGFKNRPQGWQMFKHVFESERGRVISIFNSARDRIVARLS